MNIEGKRVLVCGAGGFIGGHLVNRLLHCGAAAVRAVDIKPKICWHQVNRDAENCVFDLCERDQCLQAARECDLIFQLAADMGGMRTQSTGDQLSPWCDSHAKRAFDFALVLVFAPLLAITAAIIAALIYFTSGRPVLYRQIRAGRNGSRFEILKFRTMRNGDPSAEGHVEFAAVQRITPLGHVLRRLKLDEIPQVINILRGEMSFVGPRPKVPEHSGDKTFACRPGLTGAATLIFANESAMLSSIPPNEVANFYDQIVLPLKLRIDREYMRQASFISDLSILLSTASRVWLSPLRAALSPCPASAEDAQHFAQTCAEQPADTRA